jgi:flagellar hook-length control protein FliK
LIARSGGRSAQGAPLQGVEQSRFVERVARAFRFAESRDGVVRLRLSPPELGSVRLEIRLLGGGLAARFEAETPMAKSILVDNLPLLRDRLAEQGVRLEQFDVELTERHSGSPGEGFDRRDPRQPGHASPPSSGAAARQPVEEVPREDLVYRRRSGGQEQLDVVI